MILTVGSINMDICLKVPEIPRPGETVLSRNMEKNPGGKGANQAAAAAKLGAEVVMLGCIGDDSNGAMLRRSLENAGVCTDFLVEQPNCSSSAAYICVADSGENSIVVDSSANLLLSPAHLKAQEELFRRADFCMMQREIAPETLAAAVRLCKQHGVKTVINPSPVSGLTAEELRGADYLVPNEQEAEFLIGRPFEEASESNWQDWMKRYEIAHLIVTLGPKGCFALTQEGAGQHFPTVPRQPVDTTGAGDTFLGAFVTRLSEGAEIPEAIAFANTASGLQIMKPGAQKAMPDRAAVEEERNKIQ